VRHHLLTLGVAAAISVATLAVPLIIGVPAQAGTVPPPSWYTCQPRKIDYIGIYRADNDLFADAKGPSCISVTGTALTIGSDYKRQTHIGVVAYPKIYVGQNYSSADADTPFPMPATNVGGLTLHVRATGRAGGIWLTDSDDWFFPSAAAVTGHGNAELVIGVRFTPWRPGRGWKRVSVSHHSYWAMHYLTCNPAAPSNCWPLTVFRLRHQVRNLSISMSSFIWHMIKLGWLRKTEWLGNVAFGTECWSGCQGLTDRLTVSGMR
jgi:hypothetical protein